MNNEDSGNELFGISEQLREKKHDPHCDCGICQYCNGTEDVYGNSTLPTKIVNLEREVTALREKLAAAEDLVGNLAMLVRRLVLSEHPQNGRLKTQAMTYLKKHNLEGGIVRHTTIIGKEASDE